MRHKPRQTRPAPADLSNVDVQRAARVARLDASQRVSHSLNRGELILRLVRVLRVVGIVVLLGFYAEVLVHAPVVGQDLRTFYAAATLMGHGGDPYDARQLLAQETALEGPTTPAQRRNLAGNPYVQGPLLALALLPLVDRLSPGDIL